MFSRMQLLLLLLTTIFTLVCCENFPVALDLIPYTSQSTQNRLARRDGPLSAQAVNLDGLYYVNASIGTPPQNLALVIATDVADLVVLSSSKSACANGACAEYGTYTANASRTFDDLNQNFSTPATDVYNISGIVATETFNLGGQSFQDVTVLVDAGQGPGITIPTLGIGLTVLEAVDPKYPNFPVQLFNQKLINIVGYSIYYNHSNTTSPGRLVFGGVDTGKFFNTLETFSISQASTSYGYTSVQLANMTFFDGMNNHSINGSNLNVVLESGTAGIFFPPTIVQQLVSQLNATLDGGYYYLPYDSVNNNTRIDFQFGSTTINVPMSDFCWSYNATHTLIQIYENDLSYSNRIGLPFFMNAYTVFDYTNSQISLAPLRYESKSDNITAIRATGVAGLVGFVANNGTTGSGNGTGPNNGGGGGSPNPPSGGLSTGAKAGIGVGVAVGGLLIIGAIAFFILRRRRQKRKNTPETNPVASPHMTTGDTSPHFDRSSVGFEKAELPANGHGDKGFLHEPVSPEPVEMFADTPTLGNVNNGVKRKPVPQEMP